MRRVLREECFVALRYLITAVSGLLMATALSANAAAGVVVSIDQSAQQMTVSVDGAVRHVWAVSTGRRGYGTPNGHFRPQWMARRYFSRKYYNSPMPHSIFFHKGFAIHGTDNVSRLGGPASHGCVRLRPANAAILFDLVKEHGKKNTRIVVTGDATVKTARRSQTRPTRAARRNRAPVRQAEERWGEERWSARASRYDQRVYYPTPRYYSDPAYARWYYEGYRRY